MVKITIDRQGSAPEVEGEFGYTVLSDVPGYRHLDYQNRARMLSGQFLLEEKNNPGDSSIPFRQVAIARKYKEAGEDLEKRAINAVERIKQGLIPEIIDNGNVLWEKKTR